MGLLIEHPVSLMRIPQQGPVVFFQVKMMESIEGCNIIVTYAVEVGLSRSL